MLKYNVFSSVLALATTNNAQDPPMNTASPVGDNVMDRSGPNPAMTYPMQQYNLSETEAAQRIELQSLVRELAPKIEGSDESSFAGVEIPA